MAKRTRAVARGAAAQLTKRGVKTRAPTRAPVRASARLSKKRAIKSRRLQFTPALIADVRRRYEDTDEGLAALAADLGCSIETVRNIAKRESWRRYVPPPRDLTPAARLAARAQALAAEQGVTQDDTAPAPAAPLRLADTAEALHRELQTLLAELTATRARMKRERSGKRDLRQMAQVIASLTATLRALQPMLCPVAPAGADPDHDDLPTDIDDFRNELARRIAAFMESRPDDGDAADAAAPPADAP